MIVLFVLVKFSAARSSDSSLFQLICAIVPYYEDSIEKGETVSSELFYLGIKVSIIY